MNNFELEGWDEINQNGGTIGTGINKSIHKLTVAIFNSGSKTSTHVGYLKDKVEQLNKNLEESSKSSDRNSRAMKYLTGALVFLGIVQVLVAWLSYSADRSIIGTKKNCYKTALQTSDIELNYRSCLHSNGLSE